MNGFRLPETRRKGRNQQKTNEKMIKLIVMRTGSLYWKQGMGEYKKPNNNNNNNITVIIKAEMGGAEEGGGV